MKALLIFSLILAAAMALPADASGVKPSLEVQVLGSGGPRAFGRAGSSYIVLVDGTPRILLDAGPGAFVRIGELNIDLQQVGGRGFLHEEFPSEVGLVTLYNIVQCER
jgi:hypothetical protein